MDLALRKKRLIESLLKENDFKDLSFKNIGNGRIEFYSDNKKLLGMLDINGYIETEGEKEFKFLSTILKGLKIAFKVEQVHEGSPNLILSKNSVKQLLLFLKKSQNNGRK